MVSIVMRNLSVKKPIKIAVYIIVLLSVVFQCASCSEKQTKKEVFQIFREYDNVGFDVEEYISTAKESALYISDDLSTTDYDIGAGQIRRFIISPQKKFLFEVIVYDSVENAKKEYKSTLESVGACIMPCDSVVRIDDVIFRCTQIDYSFDFKEELEKITNVSADEGVHKQLFDESCSVRMKNDKTAEEIIEVLKKKGYDRVYYQSFVRTSYLLLNEKSQAINIYVVEDLSSPEETLSYWMKSHTNAKFVYTYNNGTLIAVIGVTVDPEPLLK